MAGIGYLGVKQEPSDVNLDDLTPETPTRNEHPKIKTERLDEQHHLGSSPIQTAAPRGRQRKRNNPVEPPDETSTVDQHMKNEDLSQPPTPHQRHTPASKRRRLPAPSPTCSACLDHFTPNRLITLPCHCRDRYCRPCLETWYTTNLTQKDLPTCCGSEITDNHIIQLLSSRTRKGCRDLLEERFQQERQSARLYCNGCQEYIPELRIKDDFGTCTKCRKKTCVKCRRLRSGHKGIYVLCPTFLDDPATALLGPDFNRCPKCFVLIEKASGCKEMRCKCGCKFQFCCGSRKCVCVTGIPAPT